MQIEGSISHLSGDEVIELVRVSRNEIIKSLLDRPTLENFLFQTYQMENVSRVKLEFIKRTLKELWESPVDLSHYGPLILQIRKTGSMIVTNHSDTLFLDDIKMAIRSYVM